MDFPLTRPIMILSLRKLENEKGEKPGQSPPPKKEVQKEALASDSPDKTGGSDARIDQKLLQAIIDELKGNRESGIRKEYLPCDADIITLRPNRQIFQIEKKSEFRVIREGILSKNPGLRRSTFAEYFRSDDILRRKLRIFVFLITVCQCRGIWAAFVTRLLREIAEFQPGVGSRRLRRMNIVSVSINFKLLNRILWF